VLQFSTAGCADRLIALVGHGTSACVIASDISRVRVLLLLGKAPFGVMRCLVVSARPRCAGALCLSRHLCFCGNLVVVPRDLDHPSRCHSFVCHDPAIFFKYHATL